MWPTAWLAAAAALVAVLAWRVWRCAGPWEAPARAAPARTMVVLGSGGHTAEMLSFFGPCGAERFSPRHYVLASTDTSSEERARRMEDARGTLETAEFHRVPRAREVRQGWASTVGTTLVAAAASLRVVWRVRPEAVVCNGPGTCLPVCVAAFALHVLGLGPPCKIVFVESFCRVRTLSMTGRLLYPFVSRFVVQWPDLRKRYPRAVYLGRIC